MITYIPFDLRYSKFKFAKFAKKNVQPLEVEPIFTKIISEIINKCLNRSYTVF